jgi:hypothetical protein
MIAANRFSGGLGGRILDKQQAGLSPKAKCLQRDECKFGLFPVVRVGEVGELTKSTKHIHCPPVYACQALLGLPGSCGRLV